MFAIDLPVDLEKFQDEILQLPISPLNLNLSNTKEVIDWQCKKGHKFRSSLYMIFLKKAYYRKQGYLWDRLWGDSPNNLCPFCLAEVYHFGATLNNSDISVEFAVVDTPEAIETDICWRCLSCGRKWPRAFDERQLLNGGGLRHVGTFQSFLAGLYGICLDCHSGQKIIGLTTVEMYYDELLHAIRPENVVTSAFRNSLIDERQYTLHEFECANSHRFEACLYDLKRLPICRECGVPLTDFYYELVQDMGFDEIFSEYISSKNRRIDVRPNYRNFAMQFRENFLWKCSRNHQYWSTLRARAKGKKCPKCSETGVSQIEKDFLAIFQRDLYTDAESNKWTGLRWPNGNGKMIPDIVSSAHKIVIEYDGQFYHDGTKSKKGLQHHVNNDLLKTKMLITQGYTVIRIRENSLPFLPATKGLLQIRHFYKGAKGTPRYIQGIENTVTAIRQMLL